MIFRQEDPYAICQLSPTDMKAALWWHSKDKGNARRQMFRFENKRSLSAHMSRIRKTDTKPEMAVRRIAHRLGHRYRLYCSDLPGTPDLVFRRSKKVIFVHGCFWHQHNCRLGKQPSANKEYWLPKLARNIRRDSEVRKRLTDDGWRILVIWECQTKRPDIVRALVAAYLGEPDGFYLTEN